MLNFDSIIYGFRLNISCLSFFFEFSKAKIYVTDLKHLTGVVMNCSACLMGVLPLCLTQNTVNVFFFFFFFCFSLSKS